MLRPLRFLLVLTLAVVSRAALAQTCGDGAIDPSEGCDDGNLTSNDGCAMNCTVELGWSCVPSLYPSGVNAAGTPLVAGTTDPHWVWSLTPDGANPTQGHVARHPAWANLPPGNWITTDPNFGASLNTQTNTYWFQDVFMPATFAGNLTFPVAVAADNEAEVFVNGVSYGGVVGFGGAGSIAVPSSAFVPGFNVISIRLVEYVPGTPRGILMYPAGRGILSQCAQSCAADADCDDGNPCTAESCLAGACEVASLPLGTTCTATTGAPSGVCGQAAPEPMCLGCVDTATTSTSTTPDLGCTPGLPYCDESGVAPLCVECEADAQCGAGTCVSGGCVQPEIDAGVADAVVGEDAGDDAAVSDGAAVSDAAASDAAATSDAAAGDAASGGDAAIAIDASASDAGRTDGGAGPVDGGPIGADQGADAGPSRADALALLDGGAIEGGDDGCSCASARASGTTAAGPSLGWALPCALALVLQRRRRHARRSA